MGLLTLPQACVVPLLTPQILQVAVPPSPPLPSTALCGFRQLLSLLPFQAWRWRQPPLFFIRVYL